ncbi:MAG: class I tRNA ligase family protein [Deltaproteobacteria bacterium]|nr:class I tRNA ligase family protein [Deltaproteobacteria bacterium]
MTLRLRNTLTREKEPFRTLKAGQVKLFTCGPSTYRPPHLGNYRTFLYEDVLHRYLELSGYRVQRLMNQTDVEDKAIAEAAEKGVSLEELTRPVEERFIREARLLDMVMPERPPKSSEAVDQAVRLIQDLMEKGYAYRHEGDVFFDPLKFEGFGKLFGLDMSRWPKKRRRFRRDTYSGRRWNLGDFILWHRYREKRDGAVYWDTDIGRGRPAWNIQDPAIITRDLGYRIDIACGGVDNLYRHHDYTIAVIEALTARTFSRFWLHGEHVLVDGAKMSKSKGNIVYLSELLDQGYEPAHVRFCLLARHYRETLNLTSRLLRWSREQVEGAREKIGELEEEARKAPSRKEDDERDDTLLQSFRERMDDDLDLPGAWEALVHRLRSMTHERREGRIEPFEAEAGRVVRSLEEIDQVLGVLFA